MSVGYLLIVYWQKVMASICSKLIRSIRRMSYNNEIINVK